MTYQEKKVNKQIILDEVAPIEDEQGIEREYQTYIIHNWEYYCKDLFGEAWITSKDKLEPDTLDQLVCDIIMAKQVKVGHTPNHEIEFMAIFADPWEEIKDVPKKIRWWEKVLMWLIGKLTKLLKKINEK